MTETKIYRHFSMGENPQSQALGLMLQKWREGTTTTEYPTEWGAALEFGEYLIQHYEEFCQIRKGLGRLKRA
jgi:hypothetical protein